MAHREQFLDKICPYPSRFDNHADISKNRLQGSGQWLLTNPQFESWSEGDGSSILWGFGPCEWHIHNTINTSGRPLNADSGLLTSWIRENLFKWYHPYISSLVIDHLRSQQNLLGCGVAYVYFNEESRHQGVQDFGSPFRTMERQLVSQLMYIPVQIEELHNRLFSSRWTAVVHVDFIRELLGLFDQTFLVFDGLDRCSDVAARDMLLRLLDSPGQKGIKIFVTSRHHPEKSLGSFDKISNIKISASDGDIERYIRRTITWNPAIQSRLEELGIEREILSGLTACCNGIFLPISPELDYLCNQPSRELAVAEFEQLKNISDTDLSRILCERAIRHLSRQNQGMLGLKILYWLVKAQRPLTVHALREAVSVNLNSMRLAEDLPTDSKLLDSCCGLIEIGKMREIVHISSPTMREYLLQYNFRNYSDLDSFNTCVAYLSLDAFKQGACTSREDLKDRFRLHPFLNYAGRYLSSHLRDCDASLTVDTLLKLAQNPNSISSCLQVFHAHPYDSGPLYDVLEDLQENYAIFPRGYQALHFAAYLGHDHLARALLKQGADISAQTENGDTPLHIAAESSNPSLIQLLLEHGGDVSATNKDGCTPLHNAAESGSISSAEVLLDSGADLTAVDKLESTPIFSAVCQGNLEFTEILFKRGASISQIDHAGYTLLHYAADMGYEEMVTLLLDSGADVSAKNRDGETALDLAIKNGDNDVIQMLVAH